MANAQNVLIMSNSTYKNKFHSLWNSEPKKITLREGKKVSYNLGTKKEEFKTGKISSIKGKGVTIGETYTDVSKIKTLSFVTPDAPLRVIASPVLLSSGAGFFAGGTYLGAYAIANYFNQPTIIWDNLEVEKSFFVFKTIPGVLAAVMIGIGADLLGYHLMKKGVLNLISPVKKRRFDLDKSKQWKLEIIELEKKKENDPELDKK